MSIIRSSDPNKTLVLLSKSRSRRAVSLCRLVKDGEFEFHLIESSLTELAVHHLEIFRSSVTKLEFLSTFDRLLISFFNQNNSLNFSKKL